MSVRIQLFHDEAAPYTNLDVVSGRVILILPADATISAINVKLEGESKTRLAGARHPGSEQRSDKQRTELELHKVRARVARSLCAQCADSESFFTRSSRSFPIPA